MWTFNKYVIYYVHATMATFAFTASENNYTNRMIFLQYMQLTTIQCNKKQSNWREKKWKWGTHFGSVLFDTFDNLFKLFQELLSTTQWCHCPTTDRHTSLTAVVSLQISFPFWDVYQSKTLTNSELLE